MLSIGIGAVLFKKGTNRPKRWILGAKGMVVNDKEKESFVKEPKDDKPTEIGRASCRERVCLYV